MLNFLSEQWFEAVARMVSSAGDLELSKDFLEIKINFNVECQGKDVLKAHFANGFFQLGHLDAAEISSMITTTDKVLFDVFLKRNAAIGMQALMQGKIKIDGGLGKILALQMAKLSVKQEKILDEINAQTIGPEAV